MTPLRVVKERDEPAQPPGQNEFTEHRLGLFGGVVAVVGRPLLPLRALRRSSGCGHQTMHSCTTVQWKPLSHLTQAICRAHAAPPGASHRPPSPSISRHALRCLLHQGRWGKAAVLPGADLVGVRTEGRTGRYISLSFLPRAGDFVVKPAQRVWFGDELGSRSVPFLLALPLRVFPLGLATASRLRSWPGCSSWCARWEVLSPARQQFFLVAVARPLRRR